MSRRISSLTAGLSALLIAGGISAAPASGPVDKRLDAPSSERNAKKPKKGADADEAAEEEAEDTGKKSKGKKGKKAKKEEPAEEEVEEKPKKKGKKAKKEEPPPEEEEVEEKPKKKKGKKGKKEEPPPEEEPVDVKDTESPTAEGDPDELPEEEPPAEPPPSEEEPQEGEKAEAAASVSSDDVAGKLYIGARLGFGLFLGKATGDEPPLADFSNKVPIWIDLGYRFSPNFLVALYGQYAFATLSCPTGFRCTGASVMRFGVQAQYGFAPDATIAPWVGLGVGYEIVSATLTTGGVENSFNLKGVEFLNLQAGADYMVSKAVGIGPFLSFSLGRYSSGSKDGPALTVPNEPTDGGIPKKEFHEWLVFGVRGAFSL